MEEKGRSTKTGIIDRFYTWVQIQDKHSKNPLFKVFETRILEDSLTHFDGILCLFTRHKRWNFVSVYFGLSHPKTNNWKVKECTDRRGSLSQ